MHAHIASHTNTVGKPFALQAIALVLFLIYTDFDLCRTTGLGPTRDILRQVSDTNRAACLWKAAAGFPPIPANAGTRLYGSRLTRPDVGPDNRHKAGNG